MDTTELTTTNGGALTPAERRPLDESPAAVYLAGLAPGSRRTMHAALDVMAGWLGAADCFSLEWGRLRFQHTAAIRSRLAAEYAPATANKALSALRGVLKAAYRLGQMDGDAYRQAADLDGVKGERLPTGRNLTAGEIAAMFAACANDPTPAGVRDAAALALLRLGLRRAEIAGLQVGDYDADGATVRVRGKGNKERGVPVAGGAVDALADWLSLRGDGPGPLLLQVRRGGAIVRRGVTAQTVYNLLAKRAAEAGVKELSPHDWRRSFVGDLLDAGADLSVVQRLAGHASPTTTARYDRRGEAAKARAVALLHTPYRRRTLATE